MRHCFNEDISFYEAMGEDLSKLLVEASELVADHDGIAQVNTSNGVDPDTGRNTYFVMVYLHN